jgi:hypothetical protein
MTDLKKNSLAFVAFATIAAILNSVVFPEPLESPYAEGVGKAVACWGLAYLVTLATKRNRSAWLFGVSMLILIFMLFVQPSLMESMVNSG